METGVKECFKEVATNPHFLSTQAIKFAEDKLRA